MTMKIKRLSDEPNINANTIAELRSSLFARKAIDIRRMGCASVEAVYKDKIELWMADWANYPQKSYRLIMCLNKDGRLQLTADYKSRQAINRNTPINMWKYGHKLRAQLWKHFYTWSGSSIQWRRESWETFQGAKEWKELANKQDYRYTPCGEWVVDENSEFCMYPDKVVYGIKVYTPRPIGKPRPKPKPRSTIGWEELMGKLPAVYGIASMTQDEALKRSLTIHQSYYGSSTAHLDHYCNLLYSPYHYSINALYPHLVIFFPKLTKRNLHDALAEMRKCEHVILRDKLWNRLAKDHPNMVWSRTT